MSNPTTIDISKHNDTMDFAKAKKAGITTVFCRCAYATTQDIKFSTYVPAALKQGLTVGSYFFATWHYSSKSKTQSEALALAKTQTNKVISILKQQKINGYVALDLELEKGCSTVLSKSALTSIANKVCDMLKAAGYKPLIYASISWFYEKMIPSEINYPLWVAYYNSQITSSKFAVGNYASKLQAIKSKVYFVQYSETGNGSNYGAGSTYIDLDYCYIPASATPSSASSYKKGGKFTLKSINLYSSSDSSKAVKKISGTYYLYDGKLLNGRYRVTTSATNCGKTPIASYVTGYVKKNDLS